MKKVVRIVLWSLVGLLAVVGILLAVLIFPGTPSQGRTVRFVGYVPLPKHGVLNVLDYLTVDRNRLFVAGMLAGNVSRLALDTSPLPRGSDVALMEGKPATHGVVIDPTGGLAFVSRSGANTVDVFDPATMKPLKSIPVADEPDAICYDPQHRLIYVASGDSKTGTLIDPSTQTVVATIALGGRAEYAVFDPQSGLIFQNLNDTNEVVALDLGQRTLVGRWALAGCQGPTGMALDAANRRLFIASALNAKAAIFDLDTHRVLATYPVGRFPDTIAFDAGLRRVYTAGALGSMTILQQDAPESLRVVETIRTHFGAHTLAVDPATHRIYLGYAGFFIAPRLAVFEAIP